MTNYGSLSYTFKSIKRIPKAIKYCIFGYCRDIETMSLDTVTIPILVQSLCLLYYYETDGFSKAGKGYQISNNGRTVHKHRLTYWSESVHCNMWFPSTSNKIIQWTFVINRNEDEYSSMRFSLITQDKGTAACYGLFNETQVTYCHFNSGVSRSNGITHNSVDKEEGNRGFKEGDRVLYILDLKEAKWKCQINDKKQWTVADLVKAKDVQYKMVLSMLDTADSVTLQHFSWSFSNRTVEAHH
eukprot:78022_1